MMKESSISPIRSDFEQIKKQDESGSEYWTSRDFLTLSLRHPKSKIQPFISVDQVCYTPFLFCKAECFCYRVIILRACNLYGDHGLRYPQCLINGVWTS